jgi:hypothetical protein
LILCREAAFEFQSFLPISAALGKQKQRRATLVGYGTGWNMIMATASRFGRRRKAGWAFLLLLPALAACTETTHYGRNPHLSGVRTEVGEPKEFVRETRAGAPQDFIPVGVTPPARRIAPRDEAGAAALEKELIAARQRSQGVANRPRPRSSYDGSVPPRPAAPAKELLPD